MKEVKDCEGFRDLICVCEDAIKEIKESVDSNKHEGQEHERYFNHERIETNLNKLKEAMEMFKKQLC